MGAIPTYQLADYNAVDIPDGINRQYISQGQDSIIIGNSFLATNRGRIKALTMSGSAGTTIELYINAQPQFVSGLPSVDLQTYENPRFYTYNRGDVIQVLATVGPSVGTVALDTETHELIRKADVVATPARQRFTKQVERDSYLAQPSDRRILVRSDSASEASSGITRRATVTTNGGTVLAPFSVRFPNFTSFGEKPTPGQPPPPPPPKPKPTLPPKPVPGFPRF